MPSLPPAGDEPPSRPPRDRVLTPALAAFLLLVALLVGLGLWQTLPRPDLAGAVRLLADGDLDGGERTQVLRAVVAEARAAAGTTERWACLLAAIALGDREAHAELAAALGAPSPQNLPPVEQRPWLHLGDPALGNVLAAAVAEAAGDLAAALQAWQRVEAQSRLAGMAFAQELAVAAVARLRAAGAGR